MAAKTNPPRAAKTKAMGKPAPKKPSAKRRRAEAKSVLPSQRRSAAESWTILATDLTRLAEDICRAIEHRVATNQELVIAAVYARAYQSFLASVRLAQAGLTDDASTLIRSMVESTIAICATAKDEDFCRRLLEDERYSLNAYDKATAIIRSDPELQLDDDTDDVPVREVTTDVTPPEDVPPPEKGSRIIWWQIAEREPLTRHLYYAHYRSMSLHVHVSMATLRARDDDRDFTHIDWRPDHSETVETVARACDVLIWTSMRTVGFMKLAKLRPVLRRLRDTYTKLLESLP
jgi:hypothetical protein